MQLIRKRSIRTTGTGRIRIVDGVRFAKRRKEIYLLVLLGVSRPRVNAELRQKKPLYGSPSRTDLYNMELVIRNSI